MNNFPSYKEVDRFNEVEDLYICSLGFEDRNLGGTIKLHENGFKTKTTLVIKYDTYLEENERDIEKLENLWNRFSEKTLYVVYSGDDRSNSINTISKELNNLDLTKSKITINISSFKTHLQVWLLGYLLGVAERLRIIYTEPEGYGSQLDSDKAFSSGVKDIFTTSDFSGALLPGYSSLLVIFLGYDFVRARGVYDQIQPAKKIGIMSTPNTKTLEDYFPNLVSTHKTSFEDDEDVMQLSIFDLHGIVTKLETIRSENIESNNILIALNGSKLHALAAILFAKKFKDVQLIISTPLAYYPKNYSFGVKRTFEIIFTKTWVQNFLNIYHKF